MRYFLLIPIILLLSFANVYATHERAGEITYRHLGGLVYEIRLLTYTYAPSPADRPELEIKWGDGLSSILPRVEKVDLPNDLRRNVYIGQHTYNGPSTYYISVEDPNRNFGIQNIPNSVNIPFYLETQLVINPLVGPNNSVQLLLPPIDNACIGETFIHNPGAYDPDGDSLSYRFVSCKGAGGFPIPGYELPPASESFTIDPIQGNLVWETPNMQGEFNVAFLIEEWRGGVKVGSVTRDMQINVVACNNNPPVIQVLSDTCVTAGETLVFDVVATDPDNDRVSLTGAGGPLEVNNQPADFEQPLDSIGRVTSTFRWESDCIHVQNTPYQMFFKATDNASPVQLTTTKTTNIRVIAPGPENLTTAPLGNTINLQWDPVVCTNSNAYNIYRRNGFLGYEPGNCQPGVPLQTGYQFIGTSTGYNNTSFTDDNNGNGLVPSINYCYMVCASFPDGAESYPSNEACATLKRDVAVITNVSIVNTSTTTGQIDLAWSKPIELDLQQVPGPHKYLIYRSEGLLGENLILIDSLANLNDTLYTDTGLNTRQNPYSYRIDLYNDEPGNRFYVGSSQIAGSPFLKIRPADNKLILTLDLNITWDNFRYTIYKQDPISGIFDSIGFSETPSYTDTGLINGSNYCYLVKTNGRYPISGFIDPIINWSQESCGIPIDNEAPCPPVLRATTNCDLQENNLFWTNPNETCADDVLQYQIWFSQELNGELQVIDSVSPATNISYIHSQLSTIAGCYAVTATDSVKNQSEFSNLVCISVDSCSVYALPNVFTPNHDEFNDKFRPFPYTSVEQVDMQIFNRWGKLVFSTNDPDINWDGKDKDSNQDVADGVYYYVCEVSEITLEGIRIRTLQGIITVLR